MIIFPTIKNRPYFNTIDFEVNSEKGKKVAQIPIQFEITFDTHSVIIEARRKGKVHFRLENSATKQKYFLLESTQASRP